MFDGIKQAIVADRYAYFDDFFANFYNTDVLAPERIGDAALRASFQVAAGASPYATYACVDTWLTDFRGDLPKIDVPTLVVHGTADRILPFEATAARLQEEALIADLTVVPVQDGPHNIGWTHPDDVNAALAGVPRQLTRHHLAKERLTEDARCAGSRAFSSRPASIGPARRRCRAPRARFRPDPSGRVPLRGAPAADDLGASTTRSGRLSLPPGNAVNCAKPWTAIDVARTIGGDDATFRTAEV